MDYLAYIRQKDKEKLEEFVKDETRVVLHPQEFLNMMDAFTGDRRYKRIAEAMRQKGEKEATRMCMLLDMLEEKGIEKGIEKGTERMSQLILCLSNDGRSEEIIQAAKDTTFQEKLMKEYGL